MRIAIASSGLGHVARGIETWAADTAGALAEAGVDVTLFAAAELRRTDEGGNLKPEYRKTKDERSAPISESETQASGLGFQVYTVPQVSGFIPHPSSLPPSSSSGFRSHPSSLKTVVLPCLKRGSPTNRQLTALSPSWAWRWSLKSEYGWEQLSFWWRLWPHLRKGRFDILHVQDPMLAYWCRLFRKWGLVRTREILAHGTEETVEFLAQFDYVQHLAPWHLDQAREALDRKTTSRQAG